ncbi:MAG: hypothetical protein UR46_C0019G0003 [Parcubacteria group bacterium GW2011_GWA1_33_6]|uniref:Uncharacterized protein n=1 Tax=Candidatus Staskawiczbacteria bacterium RIFCSPHIGHO2_02_FULL_33_16 TaxID=1802204 RepID=A0A1G2HXR7_9BACT|nr:MAG: hypothetical protein UR31_C0003G0013 [Parcubacteria group bacterium GW2011_GWA2_33_14]KKP54511.1 MAG: hypothetical protein UR46_C0019G0003 [Parcubacteria group bacterium GW2011_GWA1_33_6]OGZ67285.1 MAG: hypothetical protein A3D34_00765 [Candidatus Staskawiczbacteria bacterium RIFCSPHIGHO2_02_FULL_33_16]OGZ70197.1 MAG: hypothetical protein A2980_00345 [Candidatus Staskawiczbacteria bacterium RIFCSPLOWO2_01_FULL_33_13]
MKIVKDNINILELKEMAKKMQYGLVKAMIDVEKEIMSVDGALHADLMEFLISSEDSEPKNLWGINIFPDNSGDSFIEFDSMMNIKPGWGNRTRGVEDKEIQRKIINIVNKLVIK